MLGRLLTRLYAHLLKLYPDPFLDEFGGEMGDVIAQALSDLDDSDTLGAEDASLRIIGEKEVPSSAP
jgi:hypothetical protein